MPTAHGDGASARPVFLFSVTAIGDLVLATLAFDMIARRAGGPLCVVGAPAAPALLAHDPRVAQVRVVGSSRGLVWRAEVLRGLVEARRARASLANLEVYPPRWRFVSRAARVLGLRGWRLDLPALRADNARSARGERTTWPHRAHHYALAVGDAAGEPPPPRLGVSAAARAAADLRLREHAARGGIAPPGAGACVVVVHAGSSERARRAPPALVAALLAGLAATREVVAVCVGAADERPDAAHIAARTAAEGGARVLDLCGSVPLGELPALIQRAHLFVGGDSGPLKIAEAVGTRSVSLWLPGATTAAFAGPRGAGHAAFEFTAEPAALVAAASRLTRRPK